MPKKVLLSRAAVIARINRRLATSNERLKAARSDQRINREVGNFYVVGDEGVTKRHVDLTVLARKLGALRSYEEIAAD
jgi:hypothetical protein